MAISLAVVDRAWRAGCEALFLTLDMAVTPNREYILRSGFGTSFRLNAGNALDILAHPRWLAGVMGRYALEGGIPSQANLPQQMKTKVTGSAPPGALFKHDNMDWDEVARLRDRWPGKLVLKGILHPDDAERALAVGADGVVVSNHGARSLDAAIASLAALPAIVERVGGRLTGVLRQRRAARQRYRQGAGARCRHGDDRPGAALWPGGGRAPGVAHALGILVAETRRTMAMLGAGSPTELEAPQPG